MNTANTTMTDDTDPRSPEDMRADAHPDEAAACIEAAEEAERIATEATMRLSPEITTEYIHPPIPFRGNDWCAYIDPEGRKGWGETEAAAIASLRDAMAE